MTKKGAQKVCNISSSVFKGSFYTLIFSFCLYVLFMVQVNYYGSIVQSGATKVKKIQAELGVYEMKYLDKQEELSSLPIEGFSLIKSQDPTFSYVSQKQN